MGHSRTPTQNTAGDGFPADPIDGYVRASIKDRGHTNSSSRWPPPGTLRMRRRWAIQADLDRPGVDERHRLDRPGSSHGRAAFPASAGSTPAVTGRCCLRHVP